MRLAMYRRKSQNPAKSVGQVSLSLNVFFLLLHIGLAFLFREVKFFSTIHALLVLFLGLYTALTAKDLVEVVPFGAYIIGAEVLWRMSKADVFWEYGKYAIVLIFLVAMFKQKKPLKNLLWPLFSFLLLLPSILLTLNSFGLTTKFRDTLSFTLSGPLSLVVCVIFFSQVSMNRETWIKTIWAAVYPIVGILSLAIESTLTATRIVFGSESVFETSGGFGPNQVSAILGLGALLLILYAIQPGKIKGKILALTLSLLLIIQSFLTFSRGGIINLVFAVGAAFIFLLRSPSRIVRPLFVLFIILVIIGTIVFPQLEELTGGALLARFTDLDPVSRIDLARMDIDLFQTNPVAGVGPGMSTLLRPKLSNIASHTEYSRILAEHGLLGVVSFLILFILLIKTLFTTKSAMIQALLVASAGWAAVEMTHSAMRIVAISFMFGLAFVTFDLEDELPSDQERQSSRFRGFHRFRKRVHER